MAQAEKGQMPHRNAHLSQLNCDSVFQLLLHFVVVYYSMKHRSHTASRLHGAVADDIFRTCNK